ncbi:hypothetical protein [Escherichia coli]|uniref:hypothetical protein n=1 Tax=Escherichia coli TaxID=562 RepID=UPI002023943E|nr:hypothetical protein [Escherichia coli]
MKVYILSSEDMVVGYIGEGSTAELSSMWQSPFENQSVGGLLGGISAAAGSLADTLQTATGVTTKPSSTQCLFGKVSNRLNLIW